MPQAPLDEVVIETLKSRLKDLENKTDSDCISLFGPIMYGVEQRVDQALGLIPTRRRTLSVLLETPGGIIEVVDRMVGTTRHLYEEVHFIVPNQAMSAGTVFAMSGDKIYMNHFSALGPIDPQVLKEGKWIPALSYLTEYEALIE